MIMKTLLIGMTVVTLVSSDLSAQTVNPDTVKAPRRMAIEAGQASSPANKPPARSQAEIDAERKAIERHRVEFFARAYSSVTRSPSSQITLAKPRAPFLPSSRAVAAQPVGPEVILELRRMAIEAGQASSSAGKPPAERQAEIDADRKALESHRANFFARAYAGEPGA
jgi:hypothetical protein